MGGFRLSKSNTNKRSRQLVATNRKARHEYHIEETFEAGIVLLGTEVKSMRAGRMNLQDSFARIEGNEVFLHNAHIAPYLMAIAGTMNPLVLVSCCCIVPRFGVS